MRKNKLKQIWQSGGTVLNGWLHIPSSWSAELMAHAGWDSVTVDMQHGLHSMETAIQLLQAISTTDTVPLARANWNEPGQMMRLLDGGAYGMICPMIDTRTQCEAFVGACRYPPVGYRSFGPTRARVYGGADYGLYANDEIITIAMVETAEALANIDSIASVPGLEAIFVGSADLLLSLTGKMTADSSTQSIINQALSTIVASCRKHNIIAGIFSTSVAECRQLMQQGFRFITLKSDSMILSEYATQLVGELRTALPTPSTPPVPERRTALKGVRT
ncbi:HpcH/HpaI aldolase family protein [Spirosoma areae]